MYADDKTFMIRPDKLSLQNLIDDLEHLTKISGLKPNYDKCHIMRLGSLKHTHFALPNASEMDRWNCGCIPENMKEISTINFNIKLKKLSKIVQSWQGNKHLW